MSGEEGREGGGNEGWGRCGERRAGGWEEDVTLLHQTVTNLHDLINPLNHHIITLIAKSPKSF